MNDAEFAPGFRLSRTDALVVLLGLAGGIAGASVEWWIGAAVALPVGNFFLFCNVFRIERMLELIWAVLYVTLAAGSLNWGMPSWPVTIGIASLVTLIVVGVGLRRPSYHGVGWQRINPGLPQWWAAHQAGAAAKSTA